MLQKTENLPTVFMILGATGDLASRKIVPGLFHLYEKDLLPKNFQVIGFSRRDFSDEDFREYLRDAIFAKHPDLKRKRAKLKNFQKNFTYQQGDFNKKQGFLELADKLKRLGKTNRLFHLSVPPKFYKRILKQLDKTELTGAKKGTWTRVIIEKPFGRDHRTAKKLDALLSRLMEDEQVYRIDHYLAKEMLQSVLAFRFSNILFENTWNQEFIDQIEVRFNEVLGLEGRGAFYDGVGALRDVGQSHALQMLALVTMDKVEQYSTADIRESRARLLEKLKRLKPAEIKEKTYRAQFVGYRGEEGVRADSDTETYFRVESEIKNKRWRGVSIVLEGGKALVEERKEIIITYKHPQPCLCDTDKHSENKVRIILGPEEGIDIEFWTKEPGLMFQIEKRHLRFRLGERQGKKKTRAEEYEKLLLDAIKGDQTLFVSSKEALASWQFIDPIISAWQKGGVPLKTYKKGTNP